MDDINMWAGGGGRLYRVKNLYVCSICILQYKLL